MLSNYFPGVYIVVFLPQIVVNGFLKKTLTKYDIYEEMVDAMFLILSINLFSNPLYYFIKLRNIRKGLLDLCK